MDAVSKPDDGLPEGLPADELDQWEEQLAKWLGKQVSRVSPEDEKAALRLILGKDPVQAHVKRAKRKLAFRLAYQAARAEMVDLRLAQSRSRYAAALPLAAKVHVKALKALDREFDKVALPNQDALPAIRSAAPILNPFIDRALPKKTESSTVATQITISLTPEQARGLSMPAMQVTAQEVLPKVISAEVVE